MTPVKTIKSKLARPHVPTLLITAAVGAYLGYRVTDTILSNLSAELVISSWTRGVEDAGKYVHILDKTAHDALMATAK